MTFNIKSIDAIVISKKYKEYNFYYNYYIEKPRNYKYTSTKHLNYYLNILSFNIIKIKHYCPHCGSKISEYEYHCTPLFMYGCYKCRELK